MIQFGQALVKSEYQRRDKSNNRVRSYKEYKVDWQVYKWRKEKDFKVKHDTKMINITLNGH